MLLLVCFSTLGLAKNKHHPLNAQHSQEALSALAFIWCINTYESGENMWRTNSFVFMVILCTEIMCVFVCLWICVLSHM